MRRNKIFKYSLLILVFMLVLSIPPKKMHRLRARLVSKALKMESLIFHSKEDKIKNLEKQLLQLKEHNQTLIQQLLKLDGQNFPTDYTHVAKVIFRDPAFWASSLLIDKGMRDENFPIEKNSPVLSNGYLIGIVEEVFETFSKVRLITDKNLQFSIRKKPTSLTENKLSSKNEEFIDVGTLCGISSIDNRYRYRDIEGLFFSPNLKQGDILVTSGLDNIFPEGLTVAEVTSIQVDKEEVVFPFKAKVSAPDIKDLKLVTVLKPLNPGQ